MKKINILIASLLVGLQALAQPTLNMNNLVPVGSPTVGLHIADKLDPGASGANALWDFSNLTNVFDGNVQIVNPNQTPFAAKYAASNYCFQANVTPDTIYQYYNFNTTQIVRTGDGESTTTPGFEVDFFGNNKLWVSASLNFGDSIVDYWKGTNPYGVNRGKQITKYDAYGTVITPYDTFTNVVRIREVRWDTTVNYPSIHDTAYTWFNVNPFYQIIELGRYALYVTEAFPAPPNTVGLNTILKPKSLVSIYPNPCTNLLSVNSKDGSGEIQITNAYGQVIRHEKFIAGKNEYDVSTLSKGLYIFRILSGDGKYFDVQKIFVQ